MGVITEAAEGVAKPPGDKCPSCGQAVPAAAIAKEAGFPGPKTGKAAIDPTPVPRGPNEKAPVTSPSILGRPG